MISDTYFDSFETPKYSCRNPIQRLMIRRFMERVIDMFDATAPASPVLELGCGEGFVSGQLSARRKDGAYVGIDTNEEDLTNLRAKFPAVEARHGSIYDLSFLGRTFNVVVCTEVLEHLTDPHAALAQIMSVRPSWVILSVPHEPWFCLSNLMRGRDITRLGNDKGHVNLWGRGGFRKLVDRHFVIERHETSYPWQLILAKPR